MNAAVRAVVRMGIYVGCEVYLIKEVSQPNCIPNGIGTFIMLHTHSGIPVKLRTVCNYTTDVRYDTYV